jgi:uncharacterized protein (DUF697 family)
MSKKLPKTSSRTLADLRKAANTSLNANDTAFRRITPESFIETPENEPSPGAEPVEETAVTPETDADTAIQTEDGARAVVVQARVDRRSNRPDKETFRRSAAQLIVERHANFAALAGFVPMPWVDLAAIAVITDRMLRKLSRLYGVPIDRQRSRQLATAMLTGMAAPGIASFTTTGLLRMAPGPHILGMALTSVSAAVLIRVAGDVYISHLCAPDKTVSEPTSEPLQA